MALARATERGEAASIASRCDMPEYAEGDESEGGRRRLSDWRSAVHPSDPTSAAGSGSNARLY